MRNSFATELYHQMEENKNIWLLTGGVGYGVLDKIRKDCPERFIDCEASEQAMVDIAVGLAMSGKIPFVYAITPHLYRAFESLRNYINHEKIPVQIVGVGRNRDYGKLGFSHWSEDDEGVFELFPHIVPQWPDKKEDVPNMVKRMAKGDIPHYLNLRR